MSSTAALKWWQNSLVETGVQAMEKHLAPHAAWDDVLASGRIDFARAVALTGLQTGRDRTAIEIGCGVGRMTAAMGDHFGCVLGLDIAPALLDEARARNRQPHVMFELSDGRSIRPRSLAAADSVFSYEVFYYIAPQTLAGYFRDVQRLLRPGGEFAFQLNLEPLRWTTWWSYRARDVLYAAGIKQFRGWPTGPGFRRHAYDRDWVCRTLSQCGFASIAVTGRHLRETWFLARKTLD